jgi:hypothetical protein
MEKQELKKENSQVATESKEKGSKVTNINSKNKTKGVNEVSDQENKKDDENKNDKDDEFDKGKRDGQLKLTDDGDTAIDEKPMLKDSENKKVAKWERKTKLEKSSNNITIKSLFKEWKKDQQLKKEGKHGETTLRFDMAIQRNQDVWSNENRSDFIHSVLYGFYIPVVLVQDSNDGKKWFLDGKQRVTTLMTFMNGEWSLSKKTEDAYGFKIAGFKFSDLPLEMREEIEGETLTIVRIKNMTEQERDKMFVKLNSGQSLSRIELTRAKHSELIQSINELADLYLFKDKLELSKKARVRFVDQEIILQIAMLLEEGKDKIKGFGAGHIEEYVLRLKASEQTLSNEMIGRIKGIAQYLKHAFDVYEKDEVGKALKKIHIPIIFWNAQKAMNEKLDSKLFGDFIRSFLISNYTVNSEYGKSCQKGSSKKESVITRLNEMGASLDEFISMVRKAPNAEQGIKEFDNHLAEVNGIERQLETDDVIDDETA